jgi:Asp/Glu/hydantoin racemase
MKRVAVIIGFQFVSSPTNLGLFLSSVTQHLSEVAAPDTEVIVRGTPHGARADSYRTFEFLDTFQVLRGLLVDQPNMDVLTIANALDVGLNECREIFDIPVLGYLQTNLLFAQMIARRVALLVPNRAFVARWEDLIRSYGFESIVTQVIPLEFDDIPDLDQLFGANRKSYREEVESAVTNALGAVSADAILPCGPPTLFLAQAGIRTLGNASVIDGYAVLCKVAEAFGHLLASGQAVTNHGSTRRMPDDLRQLATNMFAGNLESGL